MVEALIQLETQRESSRHTEPHRESARPSEMAFDAVGT
jgi:hypothetical protein